MADTAMRPRLVRAALMALILVAASDASAQGFFNWFPPPLQVTQGVPYDGPLVAVESALCLQSAGRPVLAQSASLEWGDGTATAGRLEAVRDRDGTFLLLGTHTYQSPGSFRIRFEVRLYCNVWGPFAPLHMDLIQGHLDVVVGAQRRITATPEALDLGTRPIRSYQPPFRRPTGDGPQDLAAVDVDSDGDADLVTINGDFTVDVLRTNFDGPPPPVDRPTLGIAPRSLHAADVTSDGTVDLVVTGIGPSVWANGGDGTYIGVLRGLGDGRFAAPEVEPLRDVGAGVTTATLADFNGDGRHDLAIARAHLLDIRIGDGAGRFVAVAGTGFADMVSALTHGDMDGDGDHDLIAALQGGIVQVLENNGGSFSPVRSIGVSAGFPLDVTVADIDADGRLEILVVTRGNRVVDVLPAEDSVARHHDMFPPFTGAASMSSITVADLNADGVSDLVAGSTSNRVAVRLGLGGGEFAAPVTYVAGLMPAHVAIADFTGDGRPDIAAVDSATDSVTTLAGRADGTFAERSVILTAGADAVSIDTLTLEGTQATDFSFVTSCVGVLEAAQRCFVDVSYRPFDPGSHSATLRVHSDAHEGPLDIALRGSGVEVHSPNLRWPPPAAITYGTALDDSILNAAADVPGRFLYWPASGRILKGGEDQPLTVRFVPDDPGYAVATMTVSIDVLPIPLVIAADDATMPFGAPLPAFSAHAVGFIPGDSVSTLDGSLEYHTDATRSSSPGAYSIRPGGVSSSSYTVTFRDGTLTIVPAATRATLSASPINLYAGDPIILTATIGVVAPGSGLPSGQVAFFNGSVPIGSADIGSGANSAVLVTTALGAGTHELTAVYGGDGRFAGTSATATVRIRTRPAVHYSVVARVGRQERGVTEGADDALYGVTCGNDLGTIFRVDPATAITSVLHAFTADDGACPSADLVLGPAGALYGTTYRSVRSSTGVESFGTVFSIDRDGVFRSLARLGDTLTAGTNLAGLAVTPDGRRLYGLSSSAGSVSGNGALYRIDLDASGQAVDGVVHPVADGAQAVGAPVIGQDGAIYWMGLVPRPRASDGQLAWRNAVLRFDPATDTTTAFHVFAEDEGPSEYLMLGSDGEWWSTMVGRGRQWTSEIFRLAAAPQQVPVYTATEDEGVEPRAALLQARDGRIYGVNYRGGRNGAGTIFAIDPDGAFTKLWDFTGAPDGAGPAARLIQASDGALYGTTADGGASGRGTVYRLTVGIPTTLSVAAQPDDAGIILVATLAADGAPLAGRLVRFRANGEWIGAGVTDETGAASITADTNGSVGNIAIRATFFGDLEYAASSAVATAPARRLEPVITWPAPSPMTYGQPLGTTQLNAVADVPGTLTYEPAVGTVLAAGHHRLTVTFSPADPTRYESVAASVDLHVTPAPLQVRADDALAVFGAPLPAFTATATGFVNGDSFSALTGSLTFATAATPSSPAGAYPVTPAGVSSGNYAIAFVAGTLTIQKAGTTTTLTSSSNPSGVGQPLTLTAHVAAAPPGAGEPDGVVTFSADGVVLGSASVSAGMATLTTMLAPGTHTIDAAYAGGANFAPSGGTAGQVVNDAASSSATTISTAPSVTAAGAMVAMSVRVSAGSQTPGGVVSIYDGGTLLAVATLVNGTAVYRTDALAAGSHVLTAAWPGTGTISGSTSLPFIHTVYDRGDRPRASAVTLETAPAPSSYGGQVVVTAGIRAAGVTPTGTVAFFIDGRLAGSAPLSETRRHEATATITIASPARGGHVMTAVYSGAPDVEAGAATTIHQVR